MKIMSLTINHRGRVAIRWEGDYTVVCNQSQRWAIEQIAEDGTMPDCYVETENYRLAGRPLPDAYCKARRFAAKVGILYRDKVTFPICADYSEAVRLAYECDEPFSKVEYVGPHYCDDGTFSEHAWQAKA